jgi:hypothetical protein
MQLRYLLVCAGLSLACIGCGPGRGDITGQVTFQGRLVEVGSVVLLPPDKIVRSVLIDKGTYVFHNVPAGLVQFSVSSPDPLEQRVGGHKPEDWQKAEAAAVTRAEKWFAIPAKYASFDTSGLAFEMHSGENRFDIALAP